MLGVVAGLYFPNSLCGVLLLALELVLVLAAVLELLLGEQNKVFGVLGPLLLADERLSAGEETAGMPMLLPLWWRSRAESATCSPTNSVLTRCAVA